MGVAKWATLMRLTTRGVTFGTSDPTTISRASTVTLTFTTPPRVNRQRGCGNASLYSATQCSNLSAFAARA